MASKKLIGAIFAGSIALGSLGFSATAFALPDVSDDNPDNISDAELADAFKDAGIGGIEGVLEYVNYQGDCALQSSLPQCSEEAQAAANEAFVDTLNNAGEDLYDLTRNYVQQQLNKVSDGLGDDVELALPEDLPNISGGTDASKDVDGDDEDYVGNDDAPAE